MESVSKETLVEIIKQLLNVDVDLVFLLGLEKEHLETLVSCIRDRVDQRRG